MFTQQELIKKTALMKRLAEWSGKAGKGGKTVGREMFIETEDAGRVRVLTYRLDEPQVLPLFVNIHGGGFIIGHPEMDDPYLMHVATKANVKIISIDYSLAPQAPFPVALNECYAVIKHFQSHSSDYGVSVISVGGHSAGGNLSAAVCLKNAETKELDLKGAILDYPVLDIYTDPADKPQGKGFVARFFLSHSRSRIFDSCYCLEREERKNPLVSPVYATPEQLATFPPTLIITAGKDSLCAEAERFRDLLAAAGVKVTHRRFQDSPHGFTLSNRPDAKEAWEMMIEHLISINGSVCRRGI